MTWMTHSALVLAVASASAGAQLPLPPVQTPPQPTSKVRAKEVAVSVAGCIRGTRLALSNDQTAETTADILGATEFVLQGPRELMQQIRREHDGHFDEISGVAVVPPSPLGTTTEIQSKNIGRRARVTVGTKDSPNGAESPRPVIIKVQALTHIKETCVNRAF